MTAEFELLRFEAAPATAAVAVVELEGRFTGVAPARVRLLVERGDRAVEAPALAVADEDPWAASFAVELDALGDEETLFSLAPGRGPLIALPAPTVTGGADDDRFVRLARQANELRHRLNEAVAAAAARERAGADAGAERDRLQAELEAAERRATEAEDRAKAARDQRDSVAASADAAREELTKVRAKLREAEARATEAERDRAALRARAEAADRTIAELGAQAEAAEQRAGEATERAIGAEDDLRIARRDLRDTRARVEALLREQRAPHPERRGHELPAGENGHASEAETVVVRRPGDTEEQDAPAAGEDDGPQDDEERTAVLDEPTAPTRAQAATRRTRIVKIADEPLPEAEGETDADDGPADDDAPADEPRIARRTVRPIVDDGDVLDPAAVGARFIEPAETRTPLLTPARIVVGVVLLLIVAALVAILLGAGLV